jgi:hypothetical protein
MMEAGIPPVHVHSEAGESGFLLNTDISLPTFVVTFQEDINLHV